MSQGREAHWVQPFLPLRNRREAEGHVTAVSDVSSASQMAPWRLPPFCRPSSPHLRTVASLFRQSARLRAGIDREFAFPPSSRAYPSFCAEMDAYQRLLHSAALQNERTLRALFGAHEEGVIERWMDGWHEQEGVYDGLGSVWRHMAKDWTREGTAAAGSLRNRVTQMVRQEDPASVLIPGCGQARLAWELAEQLPHAHVTGLESSFSQLHIARHMLSCTQMSSLPFHPFLDEPRNASDTSSRAVELRAPDVAPSGSSDRLQLVHTDFASWRSASPPPVDCVVTCFFLDCVADPVATLEEIRDSLSPRGLWVCAGPLAYHHWPQLAPTLSHLCTLAREIGLRPLAKPEFISAPYVCPPGSLRNDADWTAAVWACRKE